MHSNQEDKTRMPFIDSVKTAAAIGLLMQHSTALYCQENNFLSLAPCGYNFNAEHSTEARGLMMDRALDFIKELTDTLNVAYRLLVESPESKRDMVIQTLDPVKTDLIELQLRGLEGAIKNIYKECPEEKRHLLKRPLLVTAQARASAAKLNHLILQMTKAVGVFASDIDIHALRALAKHGTNVFESGSFH